MGPPHRLSVSPSRAQYTDRTRTTRGPDRDCLIQAPSYADPPGIVPHNVRDQDILNYNASCGKAPHPPGLTVLQSATLRCVFNCQTCPHAITYHWPQRYCRS